LDAGEEVVPVLVSLDDLRFANTAQLPQSYPIGPTKGERRDATAAHLDRPVWLLQGSIIAM